MNNCKILLIDSPSDITLLKESTTHIPISIQCVTSVAAAMNVIQANAPDILMIGSSLVIKEGFETFLNLGDIPIVILCESYGMNLLLKDRMCNVCFITRPIDIQGIPDMIMKAMEFMVSCREGICLKR